MKSLDELVAVLQVGTRRAAPPPIELLPDLAELGQETKVMILAGTLDLMARAGAVPLADPGVIPPAPREDRVVAQRSVQPISDALALRLVPAVVEWARKAGSLGVIAAPQTLVGLLPLLQKHRREIAPVLGARGLWLAQLQGLDLQATEDGLADRRASDPDAYRERLESEFDTLDWQERSRAIAALRQRLSHADERILDRALTDRRKEVRMQACDLLLSLPGSRASKELSALTIPRLGLEKSLLRKALAVTPPEPEELPKWLPRTPPRADLGPKALALFDLIRFLPPGRWSFSLPAGQMLELATKTDYAKAILEGWCEAAVRFEDQDWVDAGFEFFAHHEPQGGHRDDLAHLASDETFERTVVSILGRRSANAVSAVPALVARKRPLSEDLSRMVIMAFRAHENHSRILPELAPYLHPTSLTLVAAPCSDQSHVEQNREQTRVILDIRKRLLDSLDQPIEKP